MRDQLCTTITSIDKCLLISLPEEMTNDNIENVTNLVMNNVNGMELEGVVLNFSMVKTIDTYTFQAFLRISQALKLMGVEPVWSGLSSGVVTAFMDLDIDFNQFKIHTFSDIDSGLAYFKIKNNNK